MQCLSFYSMNFLYFQSKIKAYILAGCRKVNIRTACISAAERSASVNEMSLHIALKPAAHTVD